jgi:RES domain-containing protein
MGGLHAATRSHTRGRQVVYLAESLSSALLEALVHFARFQKIMLREQLQLLAPLRQHHYLMVEQSFF